MVATKSRLAGVGHQSRPIQVCIILKLGSYGRGRSFSEGGEEYFRRKFEIEDTETNEGADYKTRTTRLKVSMF